MLNSRDWEMINLGVTIVEEMFPDDFKPYADIYRIQNSRYIVSAKFHSLYSKTGEEIKLKHEGLCENQRLL